MTSWIALGRKYWEDLWAYDAYAAASEYTEPVLLLQGDADAVVDISYAKKLADIYKGEEYYVIPGAGHGFHGPEYALSISYIISFLDKQV